MKRTKFGIPFSIILIFIYLTGCQLNKEEKVKEFYSKINENKIDSLANLMTDDFVFNLPYIKSTEQFNNKMNKELFLSSIKYAWDRNHYVSIESLQEVNDTVVAIVNYEDNKSKYLKIHYPFVIEKFIFAKGKISNIIQDTLIDDNKITMHNYTIVIKYRDWLKLNHPEIHNIDLLSPEEEKNLLIEYSESHNN